MVTNVKTNVASSENRNVIVIVPVGSAASLPLKVNVWVLCSQVPVGSQKNPDDRKNQ